MIKRVNPEAEAVLNRKLFYMSLPEVLRNYFLCGRHNLVVTGTHGKTTTTSLLTWIMEKAGQVAVLPAGGLGWSDVGMWSSLFEVLLPDMNGNIATNMNLHLAHETHNTLVYGGGSERLVVTIGVDDMVIVDTGDVLLVCKTDQAQKVRDVVEHLKKHRQDKYL